MRRVPWWLLVSALGVVSCGMPGHDEEEKKGDLAACGVEGAVAGGVLGTESEVAGLPAGLDLSRGTAEAVLPSGERLLVVSGGDGPIDEAGEGAVDTGFDALTTRLRPVRDTWAQRPTGAGFIDYGKSCELRVNNILATNVPQVTLLHFALPTTLPCDTIKQGLLVLRAGQVASPTLSVFPHRILERWAPGATGLASCAECQVTSGRAAAFALPKFQLAAPGQPIKVCGAVRWDITPLVRAWCKQPGSNYGVLLAGRAGTGSANFHSMEVPAALAASRPRLEITY